jgi:spore coat protein U-like protein
LVISSASTTFAATATENLAVSASVINACSITTSPVAFLNYDPTAAAANDTGQGSVAIACTQGLSPTIGIGVSAYASGAQRRMRDSGSIYLRYNLFQDTGRTIAWGDGVVVGAGNVFTPTPAVTIDNDVHSYPVYGRIPALQNVPENTYNDIVVATVNF